MTTDRLILFMSTHHNFKVYTIYSVFFPILAQYIFQYFHFYNTLQITVNVNVRFGYNKLFEKE